MGLLNRLFGSPESLAEEMVKDNQKAWDIWQTYLATLPAKQKIIGELCKFPPDTPQGRVLVELRELQKLLDLELTDILDERQAEEELIADLGSEMHKRKVRRVRSLAAGLSDVRTKHEYVYRMLEQLHAALQAEMRLVQQMIAQPKYFSAIGNLKQQFAVEEEIVEKLKLNIFPGAFTALVTGEHIIRRMDAGEQRMLKRMEKGVARVFANEITEGVTREWALGVFNGIENKLREAEAKEMIEDHPDWDFEFVHGPEFVDFVREVIQKIRTRVLPLNYAKMMISTKTKPVSDRMLNVFVHLFREWYNENARK